MGATNFEIMMYRSCGLSYIRSQYLNRLHAILIGVGFLLAGDVCFASEVPLESGVMAVVDETQYHRMLPHAFYDQASESLPHVFPEYVLLASRRSGTVGDVAYALVCFRETPSSESVVIQAVAVHKERAWSVDATAPVPYGDALIEIMEIIAALPDGKQP